MRQVEIVFERIGVFNMVVVTQSQHGQTIGQRFVVDDVFDHIIDITTGQ